MTPKAVDDVGVTVDRPHGCCLNPGAIHTNIQLSRMKRSLFPHCLALAVLGLSTLPLLAADRPNILWITSEDNGPHLGCYGDRYATTPNIDGLAAKGSLYRNAWSSAPVCAPARTTIITGVYAPSTGGEHMRSMVPLPPFMAMYPQLLRQAGYYCSNNSKEDYNLQKPGKVWDESSNKAHWKNRKEGQPFFAIFNHTVSHESQLRKRPHQPVHNPAKAHIPAYHPDTPEVRRDWAQYYDKLTEMDALVGANLRELDEADLAEDTIVFYYGDHGSGMPRNKRWTYNSGLHVPLIVFIPEKWKHLASKDYQDGGETERLVDFTDLAPTALSIVGLKPPKWMQGKAFLGTYEVSPRKYTYGFRGRMDERYDLVRSVRDERFIYIRNYMPHKIYGQFISYMFETPTTRVWKDLHDQGKLNPAQNRFWLTKPSEELFDLQEDPEEIQNLAESPDHQRILRRFRNAHEDWVREIHDVGFLPEDEIHSRSAESTPYEMGHNSLDYPLKRVHGMASLASQRDPKDIPRLRKALESDDYSAVRYWAAMGLLIRGKTAVQSSREILLKAVNDPSPSVSIMACEALAKHGLASDLDVSMPLLVEWSNLDRHSLYVSMLALNVIDDLDSRVEPWKADIKALPATQENLHGRLQGYVPRLLEKIIADLEPK